MVHVVSMLDVMISLGDKVFQSRDVNGAVCSGVFEFDKSARSVSLCGAGSRVLTLEEREMVLLMLAGVDEGNDQRRRWSPEVARRSVDCFWEDGGSHSIRVTG